MAQDLKPSTWIVGWSENGTAITVADLVAAFPKMTAAEADADSGDIRKVLFAILEAIYAKWLAVDSADRPAMMTVYRSTSVNDVTGETTKTFQLQFKVANTDEEVVNES